MSEKGSIQVQVVYARPEGIFLNDCVLAPGATIDDALLASGLMNRHSEIDWQVLQVGVYGKVLKRSHELVDGDRVEIYRPLEEMARSSREELTRDDKA
ncbi:MAG TPA: RnfH family protein [Thioalkalivibrio sp.]|nr:RnfH family protein [Thioalkalivibrio sp.]